MSTFGKRDSRDQPLTEHDVAERLTKQATRTWSILHDVREAEGDLYRDVQGSRYLGPGVLQSLANELARWGVTATSTQDA